jgi:hypothetical protein
MYNHKDGDKLNVRGYMGISLIGRTRLGKKLTNEIMINHRLPFGSFFCYDNKKINTFVFRNFK